MDLPALAVDVSIEIREQGADALDPIGVARAEDQHVASVLGARLVRPEGLFVDPRRAVMRVHPHGPVPRNARLGDRQVKIEIRGDLAGGRLIDVGVAQRNAEEAETPAQFAGVVRAKAQPSGIADDEVRLEIVDDGPKVFGSQPDRAVDAAIIGQAVGIQRVGMFVRVSYSSTASPALCKPSIISRTMSFSPRQ